MRQAIGYVAQLTPVRLAWSSKMYGERYSDQQVDLLTERERGELHFPQERRDRRTAYTLTMQTRRASDARNVGIRTRGVIQVWLSLLGHNDVRHVS